MNDSTTPRMILTAALFAALAMLVVAPAQAYFDDLGGGGGSVATQAPAGDRLDTAIQTAMDARSAEQTVTRQEVSPYAGKIPYLSHGIGVDESLFSGERSLGLTGDSPLARVSAPEPEGLTGDSALTRVDRPVTVTPQGTSSGDDFDWTSFGLGVGLAAIAAVAMGGLYFSARRGRVALP